MVVQTLKNSLSRSSREISDPLMLICQRYLQVKHTYCAFKKSMPVNLILGVLPRLVVSISKEKIYGEKTDMSSIDCRRVGRRVANITHTHFAVTEPAISRSDTYTRLLRDSGRWVETMVPGKQGGFYFIVANFYGISGSSGNNKKFVNNERLLALAVLRMLQFPNTPYFIVGDLNVDPTKSKVLANAVSKGVIHDIARQWTPHDGIIQPTFRKEGVYKGMHGSGITRVDGIMANTPGAHTVHSFEYVLASCRRF